MYLALEFTSVILLMIG